MTQKYEFKDIKDIDLCKLEDGKYFLKLDTSTAYSCHELGAIKYCSTGITHILLPSPIIKTDKLREEFIQRFDITATDSSNRTSVLSNAIKNKIFDFFLPHLSVSKEVEDNKFIVDTNMICPVSKIHCDDECCPVGSKCNINRTLVLEPNDLLAHQERKEVEVSDEEIEEEAMQLYPISGLTRCGYIEGMKAMRDKQGIDPRKEVEEKK